MKTFKFYLIFFLTGIAGSGSLYSQYWETIGNPAFPNDFLGTTNNQPLNFKTNNLYRMRLMNNTGYLGIGSQSFTPSASLHLNLLSYPINSGNLIRTDGRSNLDLTWTMFSGTNVGNSVQKARFLLSPNTITQNNSWNTNMLNASINHLQIESTRGDIVFAAQGANSNQGTGDLTERMRITSMLYNDAHWGNNPVSTTRVSISARPTKEIAEPLAMLHIGEPRNYQWGGHREWMNSGTFVNRNDDNVFFGMRPRENTTSVDANDAIIAWGDNDTPAEREDGLRFVFCAPYSPTADPGEATHLNGLEVMKIHPLGNIGMGDFSVNGLAQTPTEKLDIVGRLRVRDVPNDSIPDVLIVGLEMDSIGDYVLNHLAFPNDSMQVLNGAGQWTDISNLSGCWWESDSVDVWTGHGQNGYPGGNVGVGIIGPNTQAKFHVYADTITHGAQAIGISIFTDPGTTTTIPITQGMEIWANGGYMDNIGTRTYLVGNSAKTNVGHEVKCDAQGVDNHGFLAMVEGGSFSNYGANLVTQGSATFNIGAYGEATGAQRNIGIYGKALVGPGNYAGYFDGDVYGNVFYQASDESLKNNIQVIDDAATLLNSLNPKSYFYNDIPQMSLNQTKQYGLIAQEIEAVLPELVKEAVIPATIDSLGNIIEEEISFKAIRYNDFIPILIAGFQEQNAVVSNQADQIAAQNETINALETQLETQASQLEEIQNNMQEMLASLQEITASCCTSKSGSGATGDLNNGSKAEPELEQNIPNPFDSITRITFSLPETAQVILEITDATGRPIERLIDEQMKNGIHAITWDGSKVASGIYFYTLYADGKLITKKMIKR